MSTAETTHDDEHARHAAADAGNPEAPNIVTPPGNPALIGLPAFIVGSIALGLVLVGYVPAAAVGASIPIILTATGFGQTFAAVWAASLGESAVASVSASSPASGSAMPRWFSGSRITGTALPPRTPSVCRSCSC